MGHGTRSFPRCCLLILVPLCSKPAWNASMVAFHNLSHSLESVPKKLEKVSLAHIMDSAEKHLLWRSRFFVHFPNPDGILLIGRSVGLGRGLRYFIFIPSAFSSRSASSARAKPIRKVSRTSRRRDWKPKVYGLSTQFCLVSHAFPLSSSVRLSPHFLNGWNLIFLPPPFLVRWSSNFLPPSSVLTLGPEFFFFFSER